MLIKEIRLSPFGGAKDLRVAFGPGLNVVVGPNEAGKSTLVNALFAALFLLSHTKKGSRDWKDYLSKSLPYPHGDTAEVSLALTVPGEGDYILARSFGEERRAQLTLPDGAQVNNESKVQEKLQQALGFGRGTYEAVLFARQDEMVETVKMLSDNREAMATLGDVLRNLVLRTGGVSVDELAAALEDEERDLLARWDVRRDGPQNNRGIDNPYTKGCGLLLMAYYEKEKLKRMGEKTSLLENQLEEGNRRLKEFLREKEEEVEPRRLSMEKVERDIRRRSLLEPKLEMLAGREKELKKINHSWPKAEERLRHLEEHLDGLSKKKQALAAEQEEALRVLKGREKRELYQQVKPLIAGMGEAKKELENLPSVTAADVRRLEEYRSTGLRLKATIEAMKLSGRIRSQKPLQVALTSGLGPREALEVDKEASFQAAGRLLLEAEGWSVEVQSGEEDVSGLIAAAEKNRKEFTDKLQELGVKNLKEAGEKAAAGDNLTARVRELKGKVELLLKGASFTELAEEVARLPEDKPVRESPVISGDLVAVNVESGNCQAQIKNLSEQLQGWQEEFDRYEEVMDALADLLRQVKEGRHELEQLAPLPSGFKTPGDFMASLEEVRGRSRQLDEEIYELKLEVLQQKNKLPQETSEELQEQFAGKNREFLRLKGRAAALAALKEEFNGILEEIESQTYAPLVKTFTRYLPPLTNYRYTGADMEGAIPRIITGPQGNELPVDLLSTGTVGGLALALRLAVSEYLLQDQQGFLVMDDPLVNLDPARKAEAARILQEFAAAKQLIITTCDPATAALLGGNRVELGMDQA